MTFQHAAARRRLAFVARIVRIAYSFNTQPPEGGWQHLAALIDKFCVFQHAAARRRLVVVRLKTRCRHGFQHAAARRRLVHIRFACPYIGEFQHAAARRRLVDYKFKTVTATLFQHAAARRRLDNESQRKDRKVDVSTRSRPKAAGALANPTRNHAAVSTRSRPKAAGAKRRAVAG